MRKQYWWCKINKSISDLDLALTYLSEKTNFKFYCNDCRWVYVSNIKEFNCCMNRVEIVANLRFLENRDFSESFRNSGSFNKAAFKQVTKL